MFWLPDRKYSGTIWEEREAIFPERFLVPEELHSEKCEEKQSISSIKGTGQQMSSFAYGRQEKAQKGQIGREKS